MVLCIYAGYLVHTHRLKVLAALSPHLYGWHLSVAYHEKILSLPQRDRLAIEQVLRGWQQQRQPGDRLFSGSGGFFERQHPDCYSVTYSTLNNNAKIYVLYDANGRCLISRDDD
jgi:hypothetical protein